MITERTETIVEKESAEAPVKEGMSGARFKRVYGHHGQPKSRRRKEFCRAIGGGLFPGERLFRKVDGERVFVGYVVDGANINPDTRRVTIKYCDNWYGNQRSRNIPEEVILENHRYSVCFQNVAKPEAQHYSNSDYY